MIVVCDINAIWRERPFTAMAELDDVLGVVPMDRNVAGMKSNAGHPDKIQSMHVLSTVLPRGWASRTAWLGQRLLWKRIQRHVRKLGKEIDTVIVTSPHYLTLLSQVPKGIKTVYYASDDYRSYEGWGNMEALERQTVQKVGHSFFVSDALAERARSDYSTAPTRISVSMNATEDRFFPEGNEILPVDPPSGKLIRPIAGIIGGICDRLDFELLYDCVEISEIGTMVLVGPLPAEPSKELSRLLEHPKCVAVGSQPHGSIHTWFKCLDVGLIAYAKTELNRFCSPMRLFDHLASGAPLVATNACGQVENFSDRVDVCSDKQAFISSLQKRLAEADQPRTLTERIDIAWLNRAEYMLQVIREMTNG